MDRDSYKQDIQELTSVLAERLRARKINLVFMDQGWLAAWHSTSPHHTKTKHHTPPITIVQASKIEDLANRVFSHLNEMHMAYNGLLIHEDLQTYMAINRFDALEYRDGQAPLYVLIFQATVIHKCEATSISTSLTEGDKDGNASTP